MRVSRLKVCCDLFLCHYTSFEFGLSFVATLGNALRWIFASLSPSFPFFLTVRDASARNGRRGFAFGYGNNYKVMITIGFWLFICLMKFPSISSVVMYSGSNSEIYHDVYMCNCYELFP